MAYYKIMNTLIFASIDPTPVSRRFKELNVFQVSRYKSLVQKLCIQAMGMKKLENTSAWVT